MAWHDTREDPVSLSGFVGSEKDGSRYRYGMYHQGLANAGS